jgi:hypothetical protein
MSLDTAAPAATTASSEAASSSSSSASTAVDTSSIAASVINDFESGDANEPVAASTAATPATPEPDPIDPDDFDAQPAERTDVLGRKRENAIPHSRVKTMIGRKIGAIAKELGIAKEDVTINDVIANITESKTKYASYDDRFKQVDAVDKIMASEPERFIRMLAEADPQYKRFAAVLEQATAAAATTAAQAPVAAADDPEPQPDLPIKDEAGNITGYTYSMEGLAKARAWDRRQAAREAEERVGKRLEPIEKERQDREKAASEAARAKTISEEADKAIDALLGRAEKWPMFKDNEKVLLDAVLADKGLDIRDAYINFVIPKLAADRTKMKAELLAEINGKPKSTGVTPAAATAVAKPDKPVTTADIARQVMAQFGA